MSDYTLTHETPAGARTLGGGKTLADARTNARKVLARSPDVEAVTIRDASGDVADTMTRTAAPAKRKRAARGA